MAVDYDEKRYFLHYIKHTYLVVLAWKEIQDIIIGHNLITEEEFHKINSLILWHDNSKIEKEEWVPYARKFNPVGVQDEIRVKAEFKKAVKHHKDNNLHHFESLRDYQGPDWRCYIIELVCDYIAMGWEFDNYIFEYYETVKESINLPLEYKIYLERVLEVLHDSNMHYIEEPMTSKRMAYLAFK